MSREGLRAAAWVRRCQPVRAAVLAAELRNAVTPAHTAVQSLAGELDLADVAESVRHVLEIADALQPRPALPERDSSGRYEL